jgi:hypothetical protein
VDHWIFSRLWCRVASKHDDGRSPRSPLTPFTHHAATAGSESRIKIYLFSSPTGRHLPFLVRAAKTPLPGCLICLPPSIFSSTSPAGSLAAARPSPPRSQRALSQSQGPAKAGAPVSLRRGQCERASSGQLRRCRPRGQGYGVQRRTGGGRGERERRPPEEEGRLGWGGHIVLLRRGDAGVRAQLHGREVLRIGRRRRVPHLATGRFASRFVFLSYARI